MIAMTGISKSADPAGAHAKCKYYTQLSGAMYVTLTRRNMWCSSSIITSYQVPGILYLVRTSTWLTKKILVLVYHYYLDRDHKARPASHYVTTVRHMSTDSAVVVVTCTAFSTSPVGLLQVPRPNPVVTAD